MRRGERREEGEEGNLDYTGGQEGVLLDGGGIVGDLDDEFVVDKGSHTEADVGEVPQGHLCPICCQPRKWRVSCLCKIHMPF